MQTTKVTLPDSLEENFKPIASQFAPTFHCSHCSDKKKISAIFASRPTYRLALLECGHYLEANFISAPRPKTTEELIQEVRERIANLHVTNETLEDISAAYVAPVETNELQLTDGPSNEQSGPLFAETQSVEMYTCAICSKPVEVLSVNQTSLQKKYNLACGHFASVYFGSNKQLETPDVTRKQSEALAKPADVRKNSEKLVPDDMWDKFLPYQKDGVKFLADSGFKALLGDEMGLGKTIQAIGMLRYYPEATLPALIICPGSVTIKWQRELKKWFNDRYTDLEYAPFIHKESIGGLIDGQKIFIMSNGILAKPALLKEIKAYGFKTIIVDESHQYKNERSRRTKALFELASEIPQVLLMSGTSVLNRVMEYYNSLRLLRPRRWFSKKQLSNMCSFDNKGKPLALSPYYRENFFEETSQYILRRTKDEVMRDLPAKFITEEWVSFAGSKNLVQSYNNKLDELEDMRERMEAGDLTSSEQNTIFGIIAELRHLVGTAKSLRAIEYIAEKVSTTGEKICVGVHHRIGMGILADALSYKRCPNCKNVCFETQDTEESSSNGLMICPTCESDLSNVPRRKPVTISSESPEVKTQRLDQFKNDPDQLICILSILGGGVGLDIQFCPNVLVIEREWNRAIEDQFENRFHRIGMTNQVTICYMKAEGTIDEFFDDLVKLKEQVSGSTLDQNFEADQGFMMELVQRVLVKRLKFVGA